MAQSKREIEAALADAGARPRHQFGQNFMIDQNLVRVVAEAGEISKEDVVIEVGPGTGTLTEELIARAGKVVAVEIDWDLAGMLRKRFDARTRGHGDAGKEGFRLIEGDALEGKHALNGEILHVIREGQAAGKPVKLVANLPYNIASPLVIEMLTEGVALLAFTVQKEVALRIGAKPGGEEYGPLSVMAQMLARVEVLRTLPAQAFWPAPKIESALVRLRREDRLGARAREFGRFVHKLFSFRRKTLRKALSQGGYKAEKVLEKVGVDGGRRGEEFSPGEIWGMFEAAERNAEC
jgi:16S rRNA (adenine1518-N6/adenine1519-N6)-dimethyltransferase